MNFLAHAYLSFGNPGLLAGNMISDFVKGKKKFDYPPAIQQGIVLHREIDNYTDNHPVTKIAKAIFQPDYRLYSGALTDVIYDHFLAIDSTAFAPVGLLDFTEEVYRTLEPMLPAFPEKFQQIFPYMRDQNWLNNYQFGWGIRNSLAGVVRRSAWLTESDTAFRLFNDHFDELAACYHSFFPDLENFVIASLPRG